ncbi:MAG TPA: hypothetical protein VFM10_11005 [Terriglobales bacterium]|jgi:quercetin dioxygenase-like cupin family protein|nr:hypothetical protein [Terriglobales bacterium]
MHSKFDRYDDGRLRQPVATSAPSLTFDLNLEVERLSSEQPWQAGHTANTIVKYPDLRIVLIALKAGAQLVHHSTIGRISIHCLSGHIRVQIPDSTVDLRAGKLLTLDREVPHDVEAYSDSTFLLTIAWPRNEDPVAVARLESQERSTGLLVMPRAEEQPLPVIRIDAPRRVREIGLDKTLADTFPCSDALSSIPDPVLK